MQSVNVSKLLEREQPRRHTRPRREDDKGERVTEHESSSSRLEYLWLEVAVRVSHKGNGSGDMDHSVGSSHQRSPLLPKSLCSIDDRVDDSLVEEDQKPVVPHDKVLETELNVDVQELLQGDNLPSMSFRNGTGGIAHGQRLACSSDLVDPVSVISSGSKSPHSSSSIRPIHPSTFHQTSLLPIFHSSYRLHASAQ